MKESWFEEAARIVSGDRAEQYGPAGQEDTCERIAIAWSAYLGMNVTARDFCLMMVILKAIRDAHGPKRDCVVDMIGYLMLAEANEPEETR